MAAMKVVMLVVMSDQKMAVASVGKWVVAMGDLKAAL